MFRERLHKDFVNANSEINLEDSNFIFKSTHNAVVTHLSLTSKNRSTIKMVPF